MVYGALWDCHALESARAIGATLDISTADELTDYFYGGLAFAEKTKLDGLFGAVDVPLGPAALTASVEGETVGRLQIFVREDANTHVWLAPLARQ